MSEYAILKLKYKKRIIFNNLLVKILLIIEAETININNVLLICILAVSIR